MGLVMVYLLYHIHLKAFKEVCIALLYTVGVMVPSAEGMYEVGQIPVVLAISFASTALLNLIVFSWYSFGLI